MSGLAASVRPGTALPMLYRDTGTLRIGLLECQHSGKLMACYLEPGRGDGVAELSIVSSQSAQTVGPFPSTAAALEWWEDFRVKAVRLGQAVDLEAYH